MREPDGRGFVLMSLKPEYAEMLFDGSKRMELRRRIGHSMKDSQVFVYVTSPVMQIRGGFRIDRVLTGSPRQIWPSVAHWSGIERGEYDAYYQGCTVAYALRVVEVWEYVEPLDLRTLQQSFDEFVVPQSWRYVKPREYERLTVCLPS